MSCFGWVLKLYPLLAQHEKLLVDVGKHTGLTASSLKWGVRRELCSVVGTLLNIISLLGDFLLQRWGKGWLGQVLLMSFNKYCCFVSFLLRNLEYRHFGWVCFFKQQSWRGSTVGGLLGCFFSLLIYTLLQILLHTTSSHW